MKGGAPDEIQINITNVKEGVGFSDMTELPFGHIKTFHQIEELEGGNIQITHQVEAIITGEKENEFFMGNIWPGMQEGLSAAVANIITLAKS
ncbi:SRPBCC family protein [Elizabethkingia argenteiflava]|nr:hypothetical protein [Elizabethkingia argenteiflava]